MSTTVSKLRRIWNRLTANSDVSYFWSQTVSVPTEECPAGSSVADDTWYFPQEMIGSPRRHPRIIDWRVDLIDGLLTDPQHRPLLALCKSLTLGFMNRSGRQKHPSVSSVRYAAGLVIAMVAFIKNGPWNEGRKTLRQLTPDDAIALVGSITAPWRPGTSNFTTFASKIREIQRLSKDGYVNDAFSNETATVILEAIANRTNAGKDGTGDDATRSANAPSEFSARPFSNEYCLKFLEIHDFLLGDVADDIIKHAGELTRLREEQNVAPTRQRSPDRMRESYTDFLTRNPWKIAQLPFEHNYCYPPTLPHHVFTLAGILQTGNMERIAMASAGREGELLWMEQGCLSKFLADDVEVDLISSRRYKNSSVQGGESIGWPVGRSAAKAVEVQERLARSLGSPHLWLGMPNNRVGGRLRGGTCKKVQRFAELHELDIGPTTATLQRFRPTMALLLITSDFGNPHLVKRALGHGDLATTILYLKMNPYLQADLAVALHRKRGLPTRPVVDVSIEHSEVDIPARDLDAILSVQLGANMVPRILAPDVIAFAESDAKAQTFISDDPAALEYALHMLRRRECRSLPGLASWLKSEAIRLAASNPEAKDALHPRLLNLLQAICRDRVVETECNA
jgi:hypothetical protein